jgi:hypothetical protein
MSYTWSTTFRSLFHRCVTRYQGGDHDLEAWFDQGERDFLSTIGCKPRELFDFVEDHCRSDGRDPDFETALLITAVRRDYFLVVQKGVTSGHVVTPDQLPPKAAAVDGIVWLPRLIAKARAKLRGEMDPDTMYGCGGDRHFCSTHDIHLADLLRHVWAAGDDDQTIIDYVKRRGQPA